MLLTSQLIQTPYFMYCCWLLVDFQVVCFFGYLAFLASLLLSQGMKYCRPVCERKLLKINQRCTKNTSKVPHLRSEEATKKQVFIHYAVNGVIRCNKDVRSRIGKKFPLVLLLRVSMFAYFIKSPLLSKPMQNHSSSMKHSRILLDTTTFDLSAL